MPTLHVVHSIEHHTLEHLKRIAETLAGGNSHEILAAIERLKGTTMADAASVLAQITANTDVLKSVALTADVLNEGQETIEGLIADLKAQIAAGQTADFAPLEAAATEQATVIDGMSKAIAAPKPPVEPPPVEE